MTRREIIEKAKQIQLSDNTKHYIEFVGEVANEDVEEHSSDKMIEGWIAKNEDGQMHFFADKPELYFDESLNKHYWVPNAASILINYPIEMNFDDEPKRMAIITHLYSSE